MIVMDYFEEYLPTEIWMYILSFISIDSKSYYRALRINRTWHNLLTSDDFWKPRVQIILVESKSLEWNWRALNIRNPIFGSIGYLLHDNETKGMLYAGELCHGLPDGYGIVFRNDDRMKYVGRLRNGKAHGWGTYYPKSVLYRPVSGPFRLGKCPRLDAVTVILTKQPNDDTQIIRSMTQII